MASVDAFGGASTQMLGEVREADAVFSLTLRRVRYSSSSGAGVGAGAGAGEGLLQWNAQKVRTLRAGTLPRLLEELAPLGRETDVSYRTCFLDTYRTMAAPGDILRPLMERYTRMAPLPGDTGEEAEEKARVQRDILSFLRVWLEGYPSDFTLPPSPPPPSSPPPSTTSLLDELEAFCHAHSSPSLELRRLVEGVRRGEVAREMARSAVGETIATENSSPFNFFSLSIEEFAQSLTAEEASLFQEVSVPECLAYVRSPKLAHAPSVRAAIQHFNTVSLVVVATSLEGVSAEERGHVLGRWVRLAEQCRLLRNFSSLKAIVSGLHSSSVFRLQRSWNTLPQEEVMLLHELSELFATDSNHQTSRDLLTREGTSKYADVSSRVSKAAQRSMRASVSAVVPYLGMFLTDLTMIHSAHSDTMPDGLINFDKRRKEFELLVQLRLYQKAAANFSFPHRPALQHWLHCMPLSTAQESFARSKELEPEDACVSPSLSPSPLTHSPSFLRRTIKHLLPSRSAASDSYSLPQLDAGGHKSPGNGGQRSPNLVTRSPILPHKTSPGSRLVRVAITSKETCLYKSMLVHESDRGYDVIRSALEKQGIKASPAHFQLVQTIDGNRQVTIPSNSNVFYALPVDPELVVDLTVERVAG